MCSNKDVISAPAVPCQSAQFTASGTAIAQRRSFPVASICGQDRNQGGIDSPEEKYDRAKLGICRGEYRIINEILEGAARVVTLSEDDLSSLLRSFVTHNGVRTVSGTSRPASKAIEIRYQHLPAVAGGSVSLWPPGTPSGERPSIDAEGSRRNRGVGCRKRNPLYELATYDLDPDRPTTAKRFHSLSPERRRRPTDQGARRAGNLVSSEKCGEGRGGGTPAREILDPRDSPHRARVCPGAHPPERGSPSPEAGNSGAVSSVGARP